MCIDYYFVAAKMVLGAEWRVISCLLNQSVIGPYISMVLLVHPLEHGLEGSVGSIHIGQAVYVSKDGV